MENNELKDEELAVQEANDWLSQNTFNDVLEEFYSRGSFSVYIIHAYSNRKMYTGVGFGKARQEVSISQFDIERGKAISKGRAIHDLYTELKKDLRKK